MVMAARPQWTGPLGASALVPMDPRSSCQSLSSVTYLVGWHLWGSHTRLLVECMGGPQAPRYQLRVSVRRRKGTGHPSLLIRRPRAEARGFTGQMLLDSYPGSTTVPRCISGLCNRHVAAYAFCTLQRCGRVSGGVLHTRTDGVRRY